MKSRLQWANRNAASFGLLFFLFVGCVFFHFTARLKMEMANGHFLVIDARAINEMKVINFIETHQWLAVSYFGASLLTFIWLTVRMAPRWMFRISTFAYGLPCTIYLWMCMHIGDKFVDWGALRR